MPSDFEFREPLPYGGGGGGYSQPQPHAAHEREALTEFWKAQAQDARRKADRYAYWLRVIGALAADLEENADTRLVTIQRFARRALTGSAIKR